MWSGQEKARSSRMVQYSSDTEFEVVKDDPNQQYLKIKLNESSVICKKM